MRYENARALSSVLLLVQIEDSATTAKLSTQEYIKFGRPYQSTKIGNILVWLFKTWNFLVLAFYNNNSKPNTESKQKADQWFLYN